MKTEEKKPNYYQAKIEKLEAEQQKLYLLMGDPSFYQKDPGEVSKTSAQADALAQKLAVLYARWEELEAKK